MMKQKLGKMALFWTKPSERGGKLSPETKKLNELDGFSPNQVPGFLLHLESEAIGTTISQQERCIATPSHRKVADTWILWEKHYV